MIIFIRFCVFVFVALLFFGGPSFAGEEVIWQYRNDIQPPVYLDPADYPNDALYKEVKAKREIKKAMAEGRYSDAVGGVFKDCADCPEMVVVPAGSFRMGDLNGSGFSDEKPVHRVTIPRPFAVGKYEVTQAQWRSVMGGNPSKFKGGDRPVEQVSWNDAQAFIRKLNARTGKRYRLLSESEWEYAARAGTTTKYSCGNNDSCLNGVAWYGGNAGGKTHPVGQKFANAFGLYDMHGNVYEWVEDCYKSGYSGAPTNGSARTGNNSCRHVFRGGSWYYNAKYLRSAYRIRYVPDWRGNLLGFRLVGFRVARTL